jgi:hypothetical protein
VLTYYYETNGLLLIKSLKADTPLCQGAIYRLSVLEDIVYQINKYKPPILHDSLPYESLVGVANSVGNLDQIDPQSGRLDWENKISARAVNAFIDEGYLYFYACLYKDYESQVSTTKKRPTKARATANGDAMSTDRKFNQTEDGSGKVVPVATPVTNPTSERFGTATDFESKFKAGTHTIRWIGEVQMNESNYITKYKLFGFKLCSKEHIAEYRVYNNIVCS